MVVSFSGVIKHKQETNRPQISFVKVVSAGGSQTKLLVINQDGRGYTIKLDKLHIRCKLFLHGTLSYLKRNERCDWYLCLRTYAQSVVADYAILQGWINGPVELDAEINRTRPYLWDYTFGFIP